MKRMWINQPSTLQPLHDLHGTNVLAGPDGTVYFLSGPTISMVPSPNCLSEGWLGFKPLPKALGDVVMERHRQDLKWGGASHDDRHTVAEFAQLIEDYAGWARTMAGMGSFDKTRRRLIQVAALAVAAVEMLDRSAPKDSGFNSGDLMAAMMRDGAGS